MKKETLRLLPDVYFRFSTLDNSHLRIEDKTLIPDMSEKVGLQLAIIESKSDDKGNRYVIFSFLLPEMSEDGIKSMDEEFYCGVELATGPLRDIEAMVTPQIKQNKKSPDQYFLEIKVKTYNTGLLPNVKWNWLSWAAGERDIKGPWKVASQIRDRSEAMGAVLKPMLEAATSRFPVTDRAEYRKEAENPSTRHPSEQGGEEPGAKNVMTIDKAKAQVFAMRQREDDEPPLPPTG